jgi:CDP-diacylglycerol--serine O-phosphatidyltransferase
MPWQAYTAILIPVFSAVRLARFNVSQSDTKHFIGLATPANTIFWFGIFMTWHLDIAGFRQNLTRPELLLPLVVLFSYLLVSNLSLFSNKINPAGTNNWPVWVVLAAAVVLPIFLSWAAIPVVMLLYVASGLVWKPAD